MTENDIYIRLLEESDAKTSWKWRNDARVWAHTVSRPTMAVTYEMELDWIRKVMADKNALRFAICLRDGDRYVGNVYCTEIDWATKTGLQGTFIGDPDLWGKGIGTLARLAMHKKVFFEYGIENIDTYIRIENVASLKSAVKAGFTEVKRDAEFVTLRKDLCAAFGRERTA